MFCSACNRNILRVAPNVIESPYRFRQGTSFGKTPIFHTNHYDSVKQSCCMSFGFFPDEDDEPRYALRSERRVAPKQSVAHQHHERRETREYEYREHEHNNNLRDLAGAVIVGAATIGILGMMRR